MQVLPIQPNFNNYNKAVPNQTFTGRGKPITLQYIVEKRSHLLPKRILDEARAILASKPARIPSLMELHKSIYGSLLGCKTLQAAKDAFKEFEHMTEEPFYERNNRYAKEFYARTDSNFALRMLQEYWGNLKTKDEIAHELGMPSRNSLEWPLQHIGFVSYPPNYKTLLLASDEVGNRVIANKTTAWNALHPDLMRARNKHAAQGCKTPEYKEAQSRRMKAYDEAHPERRQKISKSSRETWANCPEVREAMSEFAKTTSAYTRRIVMKNIRGEALTPAESRVSKGFYKRFWDAHPQLKKVYAEARRGKGVNESTGR